MAPSTPLLTKLSIAPAKGLILGRKNDKSQLVPRHYGSDRSPDAAWVRQDRWDALTKEQQQTFAPICPDFVVELRSKNDNMDSLRAKMREYMETGDRLGWLLDQKNKKVEIYRQNWDVEVLDNPVTLSGEDVLPGFILNLTEVWN